MVGRWNKKISDYFFHKLVQIKQEQHPYVQRQKKYSQTKCVTEQMIGYPTNKKRERMCKNSKEITKPYKDNFTSFKA